MEFVLLPEYIAAIFVVMYIVNSLLDSKVSTIQDVLFQLSLYATLASIFFSVTTAYTAMHTFEVPHATNVLMNSAYFAFTFLMITMLSAAMLAYMFEGHTEERRFRIAFCIVLALFAVTLLVVFLNVRTGWLFTVDADENYVRGPFNTMTYWLLLADASMGIVLYCVERKHIRRAFKRIAITLPLVTPVMAVYQVLFRDTMLTGSIATLVLTTLLIYGQQQRIHIDHLTMLSGRERFYQTLELFARKKKLFHVIFISLRDYKMINNRFGQLAGDSFLREVGAYLSALDKRIVACRYSGVEFALILPNIADGEYAVLFDKLAARFHAPWIADGNSAVLSASIVDISYPEHAKSVNELIGALEYAVRQAKAAGSSGVVHFDSRLRSNAGRFQYVLRQMTDTPEERFFIELQPVHDTKTGLPRGAEVLARLRDENGRTVMPSEFIPLAEETGYVSAIDWFVTEKACEFLSAHRDCGIEWLSVNLTPLVHGDAVVEHVMRLLEKYDVPAGMLKLEITERLFSSDLGAAEAAIRQLRALGVGVYLDDFGTGYSNLSRTAQLPLECVKIDRTFVRNLETDEKAVQFLHTLVNVLHSMGSTVTIEGVETIMQRNITRNLGADMIQGYYYAKPMPPAALVDYMRKSLT